MYLETYIRDKGKPSEKKNLTFVTIGWESRFFFVKPFETMFFLGDYRGIGGLEGKFLIFFYF